MEKTLNVVDRMVTEAVGVFVDIIPDTDQVKLLLINPHLLSLLSSDMQGVIALAHDKFIDNLNRQVHLTGSVLEEYKGRRRDNDTLYDMQFNVGVRIRDLNNELNINIIDDVRCEIMKAVERYLTEKEAGGTI